MRFKKAMSFKSIAWKSLIVGHRWMGIATCLLFVAWFASGLVMMYIGFPDYTRAERLQRLEPIDWTQVRIHPERVLHGLALGEYPREFRLEMLAGAPVYRVSAAGWPPMTVSAATAQRIEHVDAAQARDIVERATGSRAATVTTLQRDQWTVAGTFDSHRPLHLVAVEDGRGLELYLSSRTGEIVLDTTARERGWNWPGAVLHWLYFTKLRENPPLWSQVVIWTSGVGIVVAFTGLWLGIDRLRIRRRNGTASLTPFRGWMAWHHLAGIVGGVFLLTWIFSGWLSMGPSVPWERPFDPRPRAAALETLAGNTEPDFPADLAALQRLDSMDAGADVREAAFTWILGEPRITLSDGEARQRIIDPLTTEPRTFAETPFVAIAPRLLPQANLIEIERLDREDAYWYSRHVERALPVLRFKFDDADRTWIHIDPATGSLAGWMRSSDRIHRWLFSALHTFDFGGLLQHRWLRDISMWMLSLAGLTISISGVVIGWRALRR